MPDGLFNSEATNREELMSSRTLRWIEIETRAAKGQLQTAEERRLYKEWSDLTRKVGRFEPNPDRPF